MVVAGSFRPGNKKTFLSIWAIRCWINEMSVVTGLPGQDLGIWAWGWSYVPPVRFLVNFCLFSLTLPVPTVGQASVLPCGAAPSMSCGGSCEGTEAL